MKKALFIAITAVLMGLTTVVTMAMQFYVPQTRGYINFGDTIVIFSGLLLGGYPSFLIGGIGSALADILSGYGNWAPFTLIIKGVEGYIAGIFGRKNSKLTYIGAVIASLEMVAGYFIVEYFLFGLGGALAELPGNLLQAIMGVIVGTSLYKLVSRTLKDKSGSFR